MKLQIPMRNGLLKPTNVPVNVLFRNNSVETNDFIIYPASLRVNK
jgi:hypothetical protein